MRGQTTLDFTIGMAVFLSVLLFVFTFVPGILAPFESTEEGDPMLADRVGDALAKDMLGSPSEPQVLDRYCTVEFFDGKDVSECQFEGNTLEERLDLGPEQRVNVTLRGNVTDDQGSEPLGWDKDSYALVEKGDSAGDVALTIGEEPPGNGRSTTTARRVVSLHNQSVTMKVTVW